MGCIPAVANAMLQQRLAHAEQREATVFWWLRVAFSLFIGNLLTVTILTVRRSLPVGPLLVEIVVAVLFLALLKQLYESLADRVRDLHYTPVLSDDGPTATAPV